MRSEDADKPGESEPARVGDGREHHARQGGDPAARPGISIATRRTILILGALAAIGAGAAYAVHRYSAFPPDDVPEGAYLRIASSLSRGDVRAVFPYLEDEAQHACFTIWHYRKDTSDLVDRTYPEPERTRLLDEYKVHASATDGSDIWVDLAGKRGYVTRLRKDLSGIAKVEISGERATVETARGTRYAFRKRSNGMWGLALFTADLAADAERAARDFDVVKRAAADYERATH
jgi:hypothetical protein